MAGPGAETTATFRSKALFLCVRSLRGRRGAKAFVDAVGAGRIFDDETKPISRELWLRALREFEKLAGDEGFRRLIRYFVHPKNLGVWSGLLRGAKDPDAIYHQLDESGNEYDSSWVWRMRSQRPRHWVGEICFLESDTPGDRRRIEKALSAELSSIPLLFGLAPAVVQVSYEKTAEDQDEIVQTVTWQSATRATVQAGVGASVIAFVTAVSIVSTMGWDGWARWAAGGVALLCCSLITLVLVRDVAFRSSSRAQQLRILALEREGVLQRQQVKEISRPHEEPVIAGKYRLGDQLGVGASGAVWKALRLTDGEMVAIKLLRTALAQDPRATDRLRREAQALGLSWHPHVVEVLDDGMLPSGVAFLVTELLSGETLSARIQRLGRLSLLEVAQWGVQSADALVAIHSAGVIHRDVKPENLYLHRLPGGGERLKLIDFGIASVSWAETRLTRHGARVGTPGYASPEQENGDEVDARTDLFALGQSLKEAISGRPPRPEESTDPHPLPGVPHHWQTVLFQLTAPRRDERFATSKEARAALAQLMLEEQARGWEYFYEKIVSPPATA